MRIVVLGLSITSSWGNGHATTYRALLRALHQRGHSVDFLECDVPWYATQRDMPNPDFCRVWLYRSLDDLRDGHRRRIEDADIVIVGSYVRQGVDVAEWVLATARGVTAFYDIDTPVTLAKLVRMDHEYLAPHLIPEFDYYFSFTGGPVLTLLEEEFGAQRARALYCSADPDLYYAETTPVEWDLGYLGTYSVDRQPGVQSLLIEPAQLGRGKFVVAGPQYPDSVVWPPNVERIDHLPPCEHRTFYNSQRFTLNLTRQDMVRAGYAPSVRLFEAGACGTPVLTDWWEGLDQFFEPGKEIIVAHSPQDVLDALWNLPEEKARRIGDAARARVLAEHTSDHRAAELENAVNALASAGSRA